MEIIFSPVKHTITQTQLPNKGRKGVELLLFDQSGKQIASESLFTETSKARFEISQLFFRPIVGWNWVFLKFTS